MEFGWIKDYQTLIGAVIVVLGWFATYCFNVKKDIAQKRLEYRLEALKSFVPIHLEIQKSSPNFPQSNTIQEKLEVAIVNFQLYCTPNEIQLMQQFTSSMQTKELQSFNKSYEALVKLSRDGIRKTLALEEIVH
jgi:hypothetical protein